MYIKADKLPENVPKSKTKCKNINIRVTPGEHERILKAANSNGLNITEWFEILIFGGREK